MRDLIVFVRWLRSSRVVSVLLLSAIALAMPRVAYAQYNAPPLSQLAIGEQYHVEIGGAFWNPTPAGTVSSEQFGLLGSDLNFVTDLAFEQTRFSQFRIVLRPAQKHRFRAEYTPIVYQADSVLKRNVTFNGISFPASLPVKSEFDWKVWRLGYEYDFFYTNRGFVGAMIDVRSTDFAASLTGPGRSEFTSAKAPLPAIGVHARGYVAPSVAINFELSGMNVPKFQKYEAHYYDWGISGTVNFTNNVGVEGGWRRLTTFIDIDHDRGDFEFGGIWFGAAVRF
jgi:hypothetical protein